MSFSKLSKDEKIKKILSSFDGMEAHLIEEKLKSFWYSDEKDQKTFDEFSENTLTNFYMPFGVAPHFLINGKNYTVPMVIEESSVVAAASSSAKFWRERGGIHCEVLGTKKVGQVHLHWPHLKRDKKVYQDFFKDLIPTLFLELKPLSENMEKRGGGILSFELKDFREEEEDYFQIFVTFETCDAMGANFINSCLEKLGQIFKELVLSSDRILEEEKDISVIMCILSNYTPECLVKAFVHCKVEDLAHKRIEQLGMSPDFYAWKIVKALRIAAVDVYRATTHNKGIYNGIDAVVLATGNDFRAIEAQGHTYAARDGRYRALSKATVKDGTFRFELEVPLSLGTIGGLTSLHPLAKISLQLLGNPSAKELMTVVAAVGLAQNFGAVNSLVTTGIQKGHMKMHLVNILKGLNASEEEKLSAQEYFAQETVSFTAVRNFLTSMRQRQ